MAPRVEPAPSQAGEGELQFSDALYGAGDRREEAATPQPPVGVAATRCSDRRSLCATVTLLLTHCVVVICIPLLWEGGGLDDDVERLAYAGSNASLYRDAYLDAWVLGATAPRAPTALGVASAFAEGAGTAPPGEEPQVLAEGGGLLANQTHAHFSVRVLYRREGGNILQELPLFAVRTFEDRLRSLPGWRRLCGGSPGCDPGESLVHFAWPERDFVVNASETACSGNACLSERLAFNGRGGQWMPLEVGFAGLLGGRGEAVDRLRRFLPLDAQPQGVGAATSSDVLQSHFLFSPPLAPDGAHATEAEAREDFEAFVADELHALLEDGSAELDEMGVRVYARGAELDRHGLLRQLWRDSALACGVFLLATLAVLIATWQPAMALAAAVLMVESLLLGYVTLKRTSGDLLGGHSVALFLVPCLAPETALACIGRWNGRRSGDGAGGPGERGAAAGSLVPERPDGPAPAALVGLLCAAAGLLSSLLGRSLLVREVGLFLGLALLYQLLLGALTYAPLMVLLERRGAGAAPRRKGRWAAAAGWAEELPRQLAARLSAKLEATAPGILMLLVLWIVVGIICILARSSTSSAAPNPMPPGSAWGLTLELLDRFDPIAAAPTASSAALHEPWIRDILEPLALEGEEESCRDQYVSCSAWAAKGQCSEEVASACPMSCRACAPSFVRACLLSEDPAAEEASAPGECSCFEGSEDAGAAAAALPQHVDGSGGVAVQIKATFAGLPAQAWSVVEPNVTAFLSQFRPGTGSGVVQHTGYHFSDLSNRTDADNAYLAGAAQPDASHAQPKPPLVQMRWRSGDFAVRELFEAPTYSIVSFPEGEDVSGLTLDMHSLRLYCYCDGASPCATTGLTKWNFTHGAPQEATATVAARLAVDHPLLAARTSIGVPPPAHVTVVWGISVRQPEWYNLWAQRPHRWQEWEFDPLFQVNDPWVQRAMMGLYDNLSADLHAQPESLDGPWPKAFASWLELRGQSYPSKAFHDDIVPFIAEHPEFYDTFIISSGGQVIAVRAGFLMSVTEELEAKEARALRERWDAYVEASSRAALVNGNRAWHTSQLWVRAEAHSGLLEGLAWALLVVLSVTLVAVAAMTRSPRICLFVLGCVFCSTLTVAAVVFSWMGWPLGFVESIALAAYVGQASTSCLHVIDAYMTADITLPEHVALAAGGRQGSMISRDTARRSVGSARSWLVREEEATQRTRRALEAALPRALGSALMTFLCSVLLLSCRLEFFVAFGAFGIFASLTSAAAALLIVPSLLLEVGPTSTSAGLDTVLARLGQDLNDCLQGLERLQAASEHAWQGFLAMLAEGLRRRPAPQPGGPAGGPAGPAPAGRAAAAVAPEEKAAQGSRGRPLAPDPGRPRPGAAGHGDVFSSGGATVLNSSARPRTSQPGGQGSSGPSAPPLPPPPWSSLPASEAGSDPSASIASVPVRGPPPPPPALPPPPGGSRPDRASPPGSGAASLRGTSPDAGAPGEFARVPGSSAGSCDGTAPAPRGGASPPDAGTPGLHAEASFAAADSGLDDEALDDLLRDVS